MEYQTWSSLKSQALADFVAGLTSNEDIHPEWELYVDGAANEDDKGAGIVLKDKDGISTEQSIKYMFPVNNNQSEYEALLAGMHLAKECGIQNIKVYCDSLLVVQQALRKKLTIAKGQWAELILKILWGYNTTPQSSTKETPFRLMFGSDTMIPVEISQGSIRTNHLDEDTNNQTRKTELDTLGEVREESRIRHEAIQLMIQRKYNTKVKPQMFQQGDLVLRRLEDV
ncbi:hypothetical protein AAHE18_19G110500 [Arachis hypogaea]